MHNASTGVTMEFTYNHEGIRTQKVKKINDEVVETTDYTLAGKKIICMQKGNDRLLFHYDESGSLIMLRHNGTPYTYVKNLQGDIVGLIDSTGALVVEYKYDAWGNPVSTHTLTTSYDALAELNPFRYRGYVWDSEICIYYLYNRYYASHISRFLNADHLVDVNLFIYCLNNPVNRKDTDGNRSFSAKESYEKMVRMTHIHNEVAKQIAASIHGKYERADTKIEGAGPFGGWGYADIMTEDHIWEVKPLSAYGFMTGAIQIDRYVRKSNKSRGYPILKKSIPVKYKNEEITVYILNGQTELDAGVIYYYFDDEEEGDNDDNGNNSNQVYTALGYALAGAATFALLSSLPSMGSGGIGPSAGMVEIFP